MIEGDGEIVTGYVEKPTLHYQVSMGIYVYYAVGPRRDPGGPLRLPRGRPQADRRSARPVGAFRFEGAWFDIGTPDEYERAAGYLMENPDKFETQTRS